MSSKEVTLDLLLVRQPSQSGGDVLEFFITKLLARDLFAFAEVDRLRLKDTDVPKYTGIQRAIVEARVKTIRAYLGTYLPVLPNSIIIALHADGAEEFEKQRAEGDINGPLRVRLPLGRGSFTIIDGQHRVAALNAAPPGFEVPVSLFVDPDLELMAYVFNKINSTQKTVNPSISYQLFGYSETNSPQKLAHEVVLALSQSRRSPFRKKMKLLGTKDEWATDPYALTQSTFARELLRLVSANPLDDEYALMSGKPVKHVPKKPYRHYLAPYDPVGLARQMELWFGAIAETWPVEWEDTVQYNLAKSTGVSGWMRAIHRILIHLNKRDLDRPLIGRLVEGAKNRMDSEGVSFTSEDFPSSGAGINQLRDALSAGMESTI